MLEMIGQSYSSMCAYMLIWCVLMLLTIANKIIYIIYRHMTVCALRYGNCVSIPYIAAKSDSPKALHRFSVQQTR